MSDKENIDGSSHSHRTDCHWLQCVDVLIRAVGFNPGTGSDLLGVGVSNEGSMDSHSITGY